MTSIPQLVHILTRDHDETAETLDPDSGARTTHTVRAPALLADLESRTGVSMERGTGTSAGPKMPIAVDAIDLAESIRGDLIRDLIRLGHHLRYGTLADTCTEWHAAWQMSGPNAAEHPAWERTLESWITRIRDLLDPPVELDDIGPCPLCKNSRVVKDGHEMFALVVHYRRERPNETAQLLCQECGPVARGGHAIKVTLDMRGNSTETATA